MAKGKKGKRSKGRKSGRLTKAEIKKAGGIKQAWAARKGHTKSPRKAARKSAKKHPKKARKSGHKSSRKGSRRSGGSSRSRSSSRSTSRTVKSTIVKHLPSGTHTVVVSPVPSVGKRRGKHSGRKGRKGGKRSKGERGKGKKKGGRKARESYAMENPLSAMELGLGLLTGAVGFGVANFVDRYLATHALATSASGTGYGDTPPTTGNYKGLFNGTAVLTPMWSDWGRLAAGVAVPAVPLVAAAFVKSAAGRSALQMFGFGAAMNTVGKLLVDGVARLTVNTSVGQRLYDPEDRAQQAQLTTSQGSATQLSSTGLPVSGLGQTVSCKGCGKTGMGACCTSCASKTQTQTQNSAPPAPPPPPAPAPQNLVPPPAPTQSLTGIPAGNGMAAPVRKNPYLWGNKNDEAAE